MSKYTEYREMAEDREILFEIAIENRGDPVQVWLNPALNELTMRMYECGGGYRIKISGETGEALFRALKQLYE
jgi:hypothetical protein